MTSSLGPAKIRYPGAVLAVDVHRLIGVVVGQVEAADAGAGHGDEVDASDAAHAGNGDFGVF